MNILQTENLTKFYGKHLGIDDVNISIEQGEILGFIGPNGAGKSTTIRLILGLLNASKGNITVFGKNIKSDGEAIRGDIGYLPSEVFYYDDMNSFEFLEYSKGFYPNRDSKYTIEWLAEEFDLDLTKKIKALSFGNKKKVAIIQCFLHNPKLLILDEPTSGLDPLMQDKFFDLLLEANSNGTTIFISSHILSEIEKICKRAVIIKEGKIERVAKIDEIVSKTTKLVTIETNESLTEGQVQGSSKFKKTATGYEFEFEGDFNELLKSLSSIEITDLNIVSQDLREAVMNIYN